MFRASQKGLNAEGFNIQGKFVKTVRPVIRKK